VKREKRKKAKIIGFFSLPFSLFFCLGVPPCSPLLAVKKKHCIGFKRRFSRIRSMREYALLPLCFCQRKRFDIGKKLLLSKMAKKGGARSPFFLNIYRLKSCG